jgi:nitrogen fixation protein FixH
MTNKKTAWRSPWVIGWVGLVLTVVGANALMIYLSVGANPGLVVDDYYDRGQQYEENMLKRLARDPGWTMRVVPPEFVGVQEPARFRFTVSDRDGNPVTPDQVTFYAYRPSNERNDFSRPMNRVAPGHYEVEVSFPLKGLWDILVSVRQGDQEFNSSHRLSAGIANSL